MTAAAAVSSGDTLQFGQLVVVATNDAASGAEVECLTSGRFTLTKVSAQAWAVGDILYWDGTASAWTNVSASGVLQAGIALAAAANPSSTGEVLLGHATFADVA